MIELSKATMAVGMFSVFEAHLQDRLGSRNGLRTREQLCDYYHAINALKHGRGASYDALVAKADSLPFRIKRPGEQFYDEGDVSEVFTLVQVDDKFVLGDRHVGGDGCRHVTEETASTVSPLGQHQGAAQPWHGGGP